MWQKSVIFGSILAGVVFVIGFVLQLATMRVLIIRSLLTAVGTMLSVMVAYQAIDRLVQAKGDTKAPLGNQNLDELLEEEEESDAGSESSAEPEQQTAEESDIEADEMDSEELQDALEDQVEEGNEEGVEEIADLISDSMEE